MSEKIEPIRRMLVLPRGIEKRGSEFEGQAIPDSPDSSQTYYRAVAAAQYALEHPEVEQVACVSRETYAVPFWRHARGTEAEAVARVMIEECGLEENRVRIIPHSRSTVGGYIAAIQAGAIDAQRPLAIGTDREHWPRTSRYHKLLLPNVVPHPVFAGESTLNVRDAEAQAVNDRIAEKVYDIALQGVEPGNIDGLLHGAAMRERIVVGIVSVGAVALAMRDSVAGHFQADAA